MNKAETIPYSTSKHVHSKKRRHSYHLKLQSRWSLAILSQGHKVSYFPLFKPCNTW